MILPLGIILLLAVAIAYFAFIVWWDKHCKRWCFYSWWKDVHWRCDGTAIRRRICHRKGILWLAEQNRLKKYFPDIIRLTPQWIMIMLCIASRKISNQCSLQTVPEGKWRPEDVAVSIAHQLNLEGEEKSQFITDLLSYYSSYKPNSSLSSNCTYTCIEEVDEELPHFFESIIPASILWAHGYRRRCVSLLIDEKAMVEYRI